MHKLSDWPTMGVACSFLAPAHTEPKLSQTKLDLESGAIVTCYDPYIS